MKVVKVLWVDSCNSNMNWTVVEDIEVEPMYIDSFGIVVKDTDEFLAIAQNYGDNPEQYSNITTIPKGCIKEVFVIHEDNVFENEQKPVDKVEPKFKVGDWIIHNTNPDLIYYVESILSPQSDCYCLEHNGGTRLMNFSEDNDYHLWTIADAKDGDMLYRPNSNEIFLFKEIRDREYADGCIEYHCVVVQYRDKNEFHINRIPGYAGTVDTTFYPATKEQRDLLFQKMHESGYEWDSEKKELKKIEQKPDFCHHEVDFSDCSEEYRKAYYDGRNNCNQQHAQLKAEQKPAWSEEDEAGLGDALWCCKQAGTIAKDENDMGNVWYAEHWLKSLKDRLQPTLAENRAYNPPASV